MFTVQKEMTLCFRGSSLLCIELEVLIRVLMCLCAAGRRRHTRHPTATCGMPLREMLVCCGTLLHEMVFLVIIIYFFTACGNTQVSLHCWLASVSVVHSFGF